MRIVHASIQREHIHLLIEAETKGELSRGMQGFTISAAKQVNRALGRKNGRVFSDRYHSEVITTPRRARHALAYVLNNWRKHGEDRRSTYKTDLDAMPVGAEPLAICCLHGAMLSRQTSTCARTNRRREHEQPVTGAADRPAYYRPRSFFSFF